MNKKSEAKKNQNYKEKQIYRRCKDCAHLKIRKQKRWTYGGTIEKLTCGIGGFVVMANALCDEFERKA